MDILIIGNGFDLAHDLKTTYKDFLDSWSCKNNLWMQHFKTRQNEELGNTWIDLETEIYSIIQSINEKTRLSLNYPKLLIMPQYVPNFKLEKIYDYLNIPSKKWNVDKKEYSTDAPHTGVNDSNFRVYIETPKGYINFLYDQLRDFTKAFENFLIKNTNIESSPYMLNLSSNIARSSINLKVISFNYTNTCKALYHQKFNNNCKYNIETIYIHGKANTDNCNLVLGTRSFERDGVNQQLLADLNIFQKHHQRHRYGTIEAYQDFLKEISNPKKIINPIFHVIGHSLERTDHNILKYIFDAKKNSVINIYYHTEEAQDKLITNITEIIGEAEVMSRVRLIHQHDDDKRSILVRCK